MSANPLVKVGNIYSYNFSTGSQQGYGGVEAQKQLTFETWGLISGDGDKDGEIGPSDYNPKWINEAGRKGYLSSDYNLDTQSDNMDKNDILVAQFG